jgi:hypothetical protein
MIGFPGRLAVLNDLHVSDAYRVLYYLTAALGFSGNKSNVSLLMFPP